MSKGVWPAVSGSIAQSQRLDVVANNLANTNTAGFKRDAAAFRQVLTNAEAAAQREEIPRQAFTDKDFYKLDGRDTAFVTLDGVYTDHSQGMVKTTNNPLDIAVEGKGFMEVLGPDGPRYTRAGAMQVNADGLLVTTDGFPVLSKTGGAPPLGPDGLAPPPPTRQQLLQRAISIDQNRPGSITIQKDGGISHGKDTLGELSIVEFVDPRLLIKEGNSLFRNDMAANLVRDGITSNVRQGMLETSNVNPVKELTDMLSATRMFEANQKVVKSYGELESRAVNDIGKL